MFPIKEFEKRFRDILSQLDELRESADGDALESMDEMNADFEDALFVIECIDPNDEEWNEEFADALEEFKDLAEGYKALEAELPGLADVRARLEMSVQLAERNLD